MCRLNKFQFKIHWRLPRLTYTKRSRVQWQEPCNHSKDEDFSLTVKNVSNDVSSSQKFKQKPFTYIHYLKLLLLCFLWCLYKKGDSLVNFMSMVLFFISLFTFTAQAFSNIFLLLTYPLITFLIFSNLCDILTVIFFCPAKVFNCYCSLNSDQLFRNFQYCFPITQL